MATATPLAYTDTEGNVWATQAEAEQSDRDYAADVLFQALVDPERDVVQFAILDDLKAVRTEIEAIFTALDP
jgi:hypothetical protein